MTQPPFPGPGPDAYGRAPSTPPGFAPPAGWDSGAPLAAPRAVRRGGAKAVLGALVLIAVMVTFRVFVSAPSGGTFSSRPDVREGVRPTSFGLRTSFPSVTPSPSIAGPVPKPLRYTGSGSRTISIRPPADGAPALLYVKARPGTLGVMVSEAGAGVGRTYVTSFGPYEGVVLLDKAGQRTPRSLRVEAAGPWVVEVRSSRGAPVLGAKASGKGDTVLRYPGAARTATVTGAAPVTVLTFRADGFLTGIIAAYDGRPASKRWEESGPLLVEVDAEGAWTLTLHK